MKVPPMAGQETGWQIFNRIDPYQRSKTDKDWPRKARGSMDQGQDCGDPECALLLGGKGVRNAMSSLSRRLGISIPSVSDSVTRDQMIAEARSCCLLET